jgi:hypothetical protein
VFTCECEGRRKENETAPEHGATPLAQPAENHDTFPGRWGYQDLRDARAYLDPLDQGPK